MKKLLVVRACRTPPGWVSAGWRPGGADGAGNDRRGRRGAGAQGARSAFGTGARAEAAPARPPGAFSMAPNRVHRLSGLYSKPGWRRLPGDDGEGPCSIFFARPVRRQAEGVGAASRARRASGRPRRRRRSSQICWDKNRRSWPKPSQGPKLPGRFRPQTQSLPVASLDEVAPEVLETNPRTASCVPASW